MTLLETRGSLPSAICAIAIDTPGPLRSLNHQHTNDIYTTAQPNEYRRCSNKNKFCQSHVDLPLQFQMAQQNLADQMKSDGCRSDCVLCTKSMCMTLQQNQKISTIMPTRLQFHHKVIMHPYTIFLVRLVEFLYIKVGWEG